MTELRAQYGPWALIAGAEGIGEELGKIYAAAGINIVLVARRPEPLEAVAERLRAGYGIEVRTITQDLTAEDALDRVAAATDGLEIGMLVFNAGVDNKVADTHDRSVGNVRRVIGLNVIAQTLFAHHFGGLMRARGRGGIIMLGSMLCLAGGGGMSVYAASKSYVYTLAQGLWLELKPHGVDVLGLIVGATTTPAYLRFGLPEEMNGNKASKPAVVAREAMEQLGSGPIWFPSDQQALARDIQSLSPADAVTRTSANMGEVQNA